MIAVIDFGSQYTHLLYQAISKLGYEAKLYPNYQEWVANYQDTSAVVLSGGPQSVYEDKNDYTILLEWLNEGKPTLGICYGMQLISKLLGGVVEKGEIGEYGNTRIRPVENDEEYYTAWMSHRDHVAEIPAGLYCVLMSENGLVAGISGIDNGKNIIGYQFHPEVRHTEGGLVLLGSALHQIGLGKPDKKNLFWLEDLPTDLDHAICAFSGGVDSLTAATYVHGLIGDRLKCLYIDTGLMRLQDDAHIENLQKTLGLNITIINAKEHFLAALKGVTEPEEKRKAIGRAFIEVFERELTNLDKKYNYLVQGTIWPDIVESAKTGSGQEVIKSHHNVGGLPENMNLKIYEPLKNFYKTDVRNFGNFVLGINPDFVSRHPFPGPGLGIRILGEITENEIRKARESDQILFEELTNQGLYHDTWQAFTVVLPVKTVGVKGDSRSYENVIAIRMVNSEDGMTATWSDLGYKFLNRVSTRIMNEVTGVNRVVYDISNKPCATIEWE